MHTMSIVVSQTAWAAGGVPRPEPEIPAPAPEFPSEPPPVEVPAPGPEAPPQPEPEIPSPPPEVPPAPAPEIPWESLAGLVRVAQPERKERTPWRSARK
jgi:hypothetical protein